MKSLPFCRDLRRPKPDILSLPRRWFSEKIWMTYCRRNARYYRGEWLRWPRNNKARATHGLTKVRETENLSRMIGILRHMWKLSCVLNCKILSGRVAESAINHRHHAVEKFNGMTFSSSNNFDESDNSDKSDESNKFNSVGKIDNSANPDRHDSYDCCR